MSKIPRKVYIVSHTHWDREWYMTYHRFRVNLVRIVRRILDALEAEDGFVHFLLDGQSIILEDYLEVCPEDRGRIERHVGAGSLSLGPWYILPDEFLVSAESTVRNLLIGHKVAAPFGRVQNVGYMPDSFGHIAQMPQILRGAGIDSFIFTRGMGDEIDDLGHEFMWRAPDGSEVLAINQCEGYCAAGGLGFEEIWHAHTRREVRLERALEQVRELFAKMERSTNGDIYLVSNGCDHFPPQRDFDAILAALRREWPDTEFVHAGLEEVVAAYRDAGVAAGTFAGELTRSRLNQVFPGVWSARMHLKQRNDECQTLLERYLEPISAYTHFAHAQDYPAGLIEHAWKLLMKNHPHDSICGCSTDDVHRDMLPRFDGVEQSATQEIVRQLEELSHTFARTADGDRDTVITLINPLPQRRTEVVTRLVPLQPFGYDFDALRLVDAAGNSIPFQILRRRTVERFWGVDYRVEPFYERQCDQFAVYERDFAERILKSDDEAGVHDTFLTIQFVAEDLPALGHVNYRITDREPGIPARPARRTVTVDGDVIENERCRVRVYGNGAFDLEHKATGARYDGLNLLEDTEDVGDSYDYSPAEESLTATAAGVGGEVRVVEDTGWIGALEASFRLRVPASIDRTRKRRSSDVAECEVRVRVSLSHDSPVVRVVTEFDNRAEDHRLRARFPTPILTDTVVSDGHFYINQRAIDRPAGEGWAQPAAPTVPQQEFSLVEDGAHGLAVFSRGLPELEPVRGDSGATLSLTLLRAVGWLSRDDFPTRTYSNAGPTLPTPEAQCPGRHRFEYAVVPFGGEFLDAGVKAMSACYRVPVMCIQGVEDGCAPGSTSFLSTHSRKTAVSAIKKHDERDTLIVRLHNLTGEVVGETLELGCEVEGAWRVDLLERRGGTLAVEGRRRIPLELSPHQIVTVEVDLARPSRG